MKKEYDFSRAKRARFPGLPPLDELARRTKVRITIMLDHDVLEHFRTRARASGAEPYQTQINRALRECMDRGGPGDKGDLLNDEGFISRLAERVARYSAGKIGEHRAGVRLAPRPSGRRAAAPTTGRRHPGPRRGEA